MSSSDFGLHRSCVIACNATTILGVCCQAVFYEICSARNSTAFIAEATHLPESLSKNYLIAQKLTQNTVWCWKKQQRWQRLRFIAKTINSPLWTCWSETHGFALWPHFRFHKFGLDSIVDKITRCALCFTWCYWDNVVYHRINVTLG